MADALTPWLDITLQGGKRFWGVAVFASVLCTAAFVPWYSGLSFWLGIGIAFFILVVAHMALVARIALPLPHIAIVFGTIQLVFAAWWEHYYPPPELPNIRENLHNYLAYAVPCVLALAAGLGLATVNLSGKPYDAAPLESFHPRAKLLGELDVLIVGGLVLALRQGPLGGGLTFLILLISQLRYVGVCGWVLVGARGWKMRMIAVMSLDLLLASRTAMFHNTILWVVTIACLLFYRFSTRRGSILACVLTGILFIPIIEHAKLRLRERAWYGHRVTARVVFVQIDTTALPGPIAWILLIAEGAENLLTGRLSEDDRRHLAARYNQGWIVNRVMEHVPANEPYANGRSIAETVEAVLLPRILAPNKHFASGRSQVIRYAGYTPSPGASMNLGYVGEMYANFGYASGIVGVGLYGCLFGLLFRWVARRAAERPLWWMFVPFVGHVALKAEDGVADVINWTVKAAVVAGATICVFPTIRRCLAGPRLRVAQSPTKAGSVTSFTSIGPSG